MSKVVTPPIAQPAPTSAPMLKIPHERIATRAYEKWIKKGRPCGSAEKDWYEAEVELRAEVSRGATGMPMQGQQPARR